MTSKYQKLIMNKRLDIRELILDILKSDIKIKFSETNVCVFGFGKYDILRLLRANDSNLKLSINTVKRIVDELLDEKIIVCVNPTCTIGLRFILTEND